MAERTKIEWTDATWSPITGCTVVSSGCTNCYAMRLAGGDGGVGESMTCRGLSAGSGTRSGDSGTESDGSGGKPEYRAMRAT